MARLAGGAGRKGGTAGLRREVIATALAMSAEGLSPGRSGNVSCRAEGGMLITPTGVPYDALVPADIVFVDASGAWSGKGPAPSSEWRFHLAAYEARPEAGAVVHAHSRYATALACAHQPIPAFHYMVAVGGGTDIPVAPYATFGTPELAANVARALKDRKACLLANHGQIAAGATLGAALDLAREVEALAAQYVAVLQLGRPKLLDDTEMARVLERFADYGRPASERG